MELYINSHYLWPPEGHQTFHCHLAIYRDAKRDVVVVSDWGDHGELDTSITDDLERLFFSLARQYFLGGPGRHIHWFEHYSRGWQRAEAHPSGQASGVEIWSRVQFKLAPNPQQERRERRGGYSGPERRRKRLFNGKVLVEWKPSSQADLEHFIGQSLASKKQCAFQGGVSASADIQSAAELIPQGLASPAPLKTWKDALKLFE